MMRIAIALASACTFASSLNAMVGGAPPPGQASAIPHGEYRIRIVGIDRKQHGVSSAVRRKDLAG